jgi:DNA-binding IscR family transcriptional regulator
MEIRDTRNGDWFWVYKSVLADPHLFPADKLVYSSLATFGGCKEINPSFKEIAKRANVSERTVKSSTKKLVKIGYLSVDLGGGRHKTNVYFLLKKPKGCNLCTVYKGCKEQQETVQSTAGNSATIAPQVDNTNKINNNKRNLLKLKEMREHLKETGIITKI